MNTACEQLSTIGLPTDAPIDAPQDPNYLMTLSGNHTLYYFNVR